MDGDSKRRSSPCAAVGKSRQNRERGDDGEPSCTGKSCAAGAIADCVAVCCCPCAVVSFLALALVKLPCAVVRRFLGGRRRGGRRRKLDGSASEKGREEGMPTSDIAASGDVMLNDNFSPADDVSLEVGHLGFGRYHERGN